MKASLERFSAPLLNDNIIQRIKIVMEIDRLSRRSILFIHSPAGYGKTTAVALWARRKNTAWFSLDDYSCDAVEIYKRLLLALSYRISASYDDAPMWRCRNVPTPVRKLSTYLKFITALNLIWQKQISINIPRRRATGYVVLKRYWSRV